jgi:hypothetical protein
MTNFVPKYSFQNLVFRIHFHWIRIRIQVIVFNGEKTQKYRVYFKTLDVTFSSSKHEIFKIVVIGSTVIYCKLVAEYLKY